MINRLTDGTVCEYADFRGQAIKPRRTQAAQRRELESSIDALTEQGDFWSIDVLRKAAARLAVNTEEEKENFYALYFALAKVLNAKPGEYLIIHME